ncbi:hypothetical protein RQP46_006304 [Phenoliferia psychrophenolica]
MSSQPVKRLRRSARLAGPSTACPIVDLPLELMEKVVSHLSYEELYTLASTSKPFQNTYRLRAVLMKLERYAMCDYVNDSTDGGWERELFCLSDAQPGEFGWEPFFMMISEDSLHIEDGKQVLDVTGISPAFERFDLEGPTNSYLFIKQIKSRVWLKSQYFEKAHHFQTDLDESESIDWDSELAGRLVRATPKLLKSRFKCPECHGTGYMAIGTTEVGKRRVSPSLLDCVA